MTYISRKTRVIVSRWLDECDAEYTWRACRKRSDGRLKRHTSCDDLRAWVNNNCDKHDHLVDLMSDGEAIYKTNIRLYGRFIPVPVLIKVLQNTRDSINEIQKREKEKNLAGEIGKFKGNQAIKVKSGNSNEPNAGTGNQDSKLPSNSSLTRIEFENHTLEKRLYQCSSLLCKAIGKLEKIDSIVSQANKDFQNARNEEIEESFRKSKLACSCSLSNQLGQNYETFSSSKSHMRKVKNSSKYTELLRKISGLREKLKNIQECRNEIKHQIQSSQQRIGKCSSSLQVTELFNRQEKACIRRLQKIKERLMIERGRLLSEISEALNCLNNLKKSSRSSMSSRKRNSKSWPREDSFRSEGDESASCGCGCQGSENFEFTSENIEYRESSSLEDNVMSDGYPKLKQTDNDFFCDGKGFTHENLNDYGAYNSDTLYEEKNDLKKSEFVKRNNQNDKSLTQLNSTSISDLLASNPLANEEKPRDPDKPSKQSKTVKPLKKSKLHYTCPEPSCRKKVYASDPNDFPNYLSSQHHTVLLALGNPTTPRPNTSPTTKAERLEKSFERDSCNPKGNIPERKIKSETTMKEIEKALRNYEQRLNDLDGLEYEIEELKQKLSEVNRLKKQLAKREAEGKKLRAADREKSNREITKLCSENWELKKQVQQLTEKFETQCKKIQSLKCIAKKAKKLECEAEELKKELSEYRNSFEHQRKCITKWESLVAVQRTDIENLMNHIGKLTAMKEAVTCSPCCEKKNVQRSRSYSPESIKMKKMMRPKTQVRGYKLSSDEEDPAYYCDEYRQQDYRKGCQERSFDSGCYSPPSMGNMEWCMN